jgi:hypothetical protein
MNPTHEEALSQLASEKPACERRELLDVISQSDPALRQRPEALLAGKDNQAERSIHAGHSA